MTFDSNRLTLPPPLSGQSYGVGLKCEKNICFRVPILIATVIPIIFKKYKITQDKETWVFSVYLII